MPKEKLEEEFGNKNVPHLKNIQLKEKINAKLG